MYATLGVIASSELDYVGVGLRDEGAHARQRRDAPVAERRDAGINQVGGRVRASWCLRASPCSSLWLVRAECFVDAYKQVFEAFERCLAQCGENPVTITQ